MRLLLPGLLFLFSISVFPQKDILVDPNRDSIEQIALLSDMLINGYLKETRAFADKNLTPLLKRYFQDKEIKDCLFPELPWLKTLFPEDSSFVIMTWQFKINENRFKYRGLVKNDLGTFQLNDREVDFNFLKTAEKSQEEWPGAFYYNLKEFGKKGDRKYLIFGYHAHKKTESYKLVDILWFDEEGQPRFGAPVFVFPDPKKDSPGELYRYSRKYRSNANFIFNYDEERGVIVFDNLMLVGSRVQGDMPVEVPDGTYSTFRYQKGKWIFRDYLFEEKDDSPINAVPLSDKE